VKVSITVLYMCICDFCVLKNSQKLEMRPFRIPRKELFSAAREQAIKIGPYYFRWLGNKPIENKLDAIFGGPIIFSGFILPGKNY
jgi:hypothetical protein